MELELDLYMIMVVKTTIQTNRNISVYFIIYNIRYLDIFSNLL